MVFLDLSNAAEVWFGDAEASEVWFGNNKVWTKPVVGPPFSYVADLTAGLDDWFRVSGSATVSWNNAINTAHQTIQAQLNTGTGTTVVGRTLTGFNVGKTYLVELEIARSSTNVTNLAAGVDGSYGTAQTPSTNTFVTVSHTFVATSTTHTIEGRGQFLSAGTRRYYIRAASVTQLD